MGIAKNCPYTTYLDDKIGLGFSIRCKLGEDFSMLHQHHFYETMIVLNGTFSFWLSDREVLILNENQMAILPPDTRHRSKSTGMNIQFAISPENAREAFQYLYGANNIPDMSKPLVFTLSKNLVDYIKSQIHYASLINPHNYQRRRTLIKRMLVIVLGEIFEPYSNKPEEVVTEIPIWFKELLESYENLEILSGGLKEMTKITHMSEEHLCRSFRKYTGMTPTEFINNRRMHYAANMLRYSNREIIQICEDLNISSLSYFYRVFKRNYGVSPYQYRKGKESVAPVQSHFTTIVS